VLDEKQVLNWDFNKPFHLKDSAFNYRSIITGYTEGILSGFTFYQISKPKERLVNRIFAFNLPISRLYKIAYSKMATEYSDMDYNNLVVFRTVDSLKYFSPALNSPLFKKSKYKTKQDWSKENLHCYELILPQPVTDSCAFAYMFDDLQRNFRLNAYIKKERKLCSIITLAYKSKDKLFPLSVKDSSFFKITDKGILAEDITLTRLFENLNVEIRPGINSKPLDPSYINETGINYSIDLSLTFSTNKPTYKEIKRQLENKYGFQFKLAERKVPVLMIDDSNYN